MLALRPNCECCGRDLPPGQSRRADLFLRMHLVRGLCAHEAARQPLPELRRQPGAAPDPSGGQTREVPSLDRPHPSPRALRRPCHCLTVVPDRTRRTALILNGLVLTAFLLLATGSLMLGRGLVAICMFFFCVFVAAVAGFNMSVVQEAARLLSEEDRLGAEIRREKLRRELAEVHTAAARNSDPIEGPPP